MASVTVGGKNYHIPVLNFIALERAWPSIEACMIARGPIDGVRAGINIIAAGLIESPTFSVADFDIDMDAVNATGKDPDTVIFEKVVHFLKKNLLATEMAAVRAAVDEITMEAGLVPEEGELTVVEPNLSTETSDPSSLNSSQPALKADPGTP